MPADPVVEFASRDDARYAKITGCPKCGGRLFLESAEATEDYQYGEDEFSIRLVCERCGAKIYVEARGGELYLGDVFSAVENGDPTLRVEGKLPWEDAGEDVGVDSGAT